MPNNVKLYGRFFTTLFLEILLQIYVDFINICCNNMLEWLGVFPNPVSFGAASVNERSGGLKSSHCFFPGVIIRLGMKIIKSA